MLDRGPVIRSYADKEILLVDDSERFLYGARRQLMLRGFERVELARSTAEATRVFAARRFDILLVDVHLDGSEQDGLELLRDLRVGGYDGLAVTVSGDESIVHFVRALRAGANDYLVKGVYLDLPSELVRLLEEPTTRDPVEADHVSLTIERTGYLRSLGLTPRELDLVRAFARDFPRYRALSDRIGRSEPQIRKAFSRVFDKLDVDGPAQLARLLTLCSLYD